MELDVGSKTGAAFGREERGSLGAAQRLPRSGRRDAGRDDRAAHSEAQERLVFSGLSGAAAARREGADHGHPARASRPRDPTLKGSRSGDRDGEAYSQGISTRSVDVLVEALGMTGISKSRVSRLCEDIDAGVPEAIYRLGGGERVDAFLDRPIEGDWPSLWPPHAAGCMGTPADRCELREGSPERSDRLTPSRQAGSGTPGSRSPLSLRSVSTATAGALRGLLTASLPEIGSKACWLSMVFTATPPGPAGPVSFRDRINGLLAMHGRGRARSPGLNDLPGPTPHQAALDRSDRAPEPRVRAPHPTAACWPLIVVGSFPDEAAISPRVPPWLPAAMG